MSYRLFKIITLMVLVVLLVSSGLLWIKVYDKTEAVNIIMNGGGTKEQIISPIVTPNQTIKPLATPTPSITIETLDSSFTDLDIVSQVAQNMGRTININDQEQAQSFIDDFSKLNYEDRIKYGVWAEGTPEREQQKGMLGE